MFRKAGLASTTRFLRVGGHHAVRKSVDHHPETGLLAGDILKGPDITNCLGDHHAELIRGEGFGNEIKGPFFHGFDGMFDGCETGDDNDDRIRMNRPDFR